MAISIFGGGATTAGGGLTTEIGGGGSSCTETFLVIIVAVSSPTVLRIWSLDKPMTSAEMITTWMPMTMPRLTVLFLLP